MGFAHRTTTPRPRYGIDAPYVPAGLAAGGLACVVGARLIGRRWLAVPGVALLAQAALYLHTTLRGKLRVWERELDQLKLRGDEQLLDLGCGRGAVLIAAAQRLPRGRAVGVDLWRSQDQIGNDPDVTRTNAAAAGVDDRVELHTADMTALPFPTRASTSSPAHWPSTTSPTPPAAPARSPRRCASCAPPADC
jgi:arsenite methyltransferase